MTDTPTTEAILIRQQIVRLNKKFNELDALSKMYDRGYRDDYWLCYREYTEELDKLGELYMEAETDDLERTEV